MGAVGSDAYQEHSSNVGKEGSFGFRVKPWRFVRVMPPLIIGVRYTRVM